LRDWSNVRIDAPRTLQLTTGQQATFAFTMHNDGPWTVAVDNGCPWFTHAGASIACSTPISDKLGPGESASSVAIFYAREYATPSTEPRRDTDPWDPIYPSTYYIHGMLRDQFVFDDQSGANSRAVIGVGVFADDLKLTITADRPAVTLGIGESTTVTVTMRNDRPERVWDWGCHQLDGAGPTGAPPNGVPAVLCPDRGWREPGWSATFTATVSAVGRGPGQYVLSWGVVPEFPLVTLTVVP
jgi:hypothetical protein